MVLHDKPKLVALSYAITLMAASERFDPPRAGMPRSIAESVVGHLLACTVECRMRAN